MKKLFSIFSLMLIVILLLSACAPASGGGTGGNGLTDLGGKTIVVAVENAYPPFNSIDETSGKGVGWDYDAVTEICKLCARIQGSRLGRHLPRHAGR
jgi:ABC-type amino acid transport substrate-binding protein